MVTDCVLGNCILRATFAKPSAYFTISLPYFFPLFQRLKRITDAGRRKWGEAKMARRQKEITYLRVLLIWLQGYWTE
jgi:hypothetical protein